MNHRDADGVCVARLLEVDGLALPADIAAVSAVHAGDDFHHRGLAGAVLADERVNLSRIGAQVASFEGLNAAEILADAF
jgi:hypothetical protein